MSKNNSDDNNGYLEIKNKNGENKKLNESIIKSNTLDEA